METAEERRRKVLDKLQELGISYVMHEHPPLPTIEEAMKYWKDFDSTHCKNLFFRNHKGNRHYLVILECHKQMDIHGHGSRLRLPLRADQRPGPSGQALSGQGSAPCRKGHLPPQRQHRLAGNLPRQHVPLHPALGRRMGRVVGGGIVLKSVIARDFVNGRGPLRSSGRDSEAYFSAAAKQWEG